MSVESLEVGRWYRTCNSPLSDWFVNVLDIKDGVCVFYFEGESRNKPHKKALVDFKNKVEHLEDWFIEMYLDKNFTQK